MADVKVALQEIKEESESGERRLRDRRAASRHDWPRSSAWRTC